MTRTQFGTVTKEPNLEKSPAEDARHEGALVTMKRRGLHFGHQRTADAWFPTETPSHARHVPSRVSSPRVPWIEAV